MSNSEQHADAGFQAYQATYLDPAQAQALASFMPEFAGVDAASQAAAMQLHYGQAPQLGGQQQAQHSETESDLEEGMDAAQHRLTIAAVDAQATKNDEAWTEEEEQELLGLVNDAAYRKDKLGETSTKWAPIAQRFSRTVKAVKRKYDKLAYPDKEQRKSRRLSANGDGSDGGLGGMYLGSDGSGLPLYQQHMTDEQLAVAAAMQGAAGGMTSEQVAAYMEAYGQWQGYADGGDGVEEGGQGGDPMAVHHQLVAQYAQPLGAAGAGSVAFPRNDRVFWKPEEQQELLRIVQDGAYRQQVLRCVDVNWDLIAKHLGRGKRSVQRKYDNLKGAAAGGGELALPANDGKKWSAEEVAELVRLVEDGAYRAEVLAMEKVDWRVLGQHFGRSYESVSYKYSYVKNTGRTGVEGKPKHAKAKHETSYKEMAIWALQQIGGEGTSGQICNVIATNPAYAPQLDTAIVSGKKTLQRWKHGVRSALNAFPMFDKTQRIFEGEVVWHLVEEAVAQEASAQQEKAARQRNKPLSGAQRRKLKRAQAEAGGGGEEGQEEEGAQQALAQMAAQRPKKRRGGAAEAEQGGGGGGRLAVEQANVHVAVAEAAAAAAAAAGMPTDAQSQMQLLAQAQLPLMQQLYDASAAAITAEQLSMLQPEQLALLPPEQLALLHHQMQQGQLGSLSTMPLVVSSEAAADGEAANNASHPHHEQQQQPQAQQHGYNAAQQEQQHQVAQQGYEPEHNYDAARQAALEAHHQYQTQYHEQGQHAQQAYEQGPYDPHDPATAAALAAQQQQLAEHYAAAGLMLDPATAEAAAVEHLAAGVQLGQPVGQGGALDMSSLAHQHVQAGYDYAQYYQQQHYQQYQYDPTQYAAAAADAAQYGQPEEQQQYAHHHAVDPAQYVQGGEATQYVQGGETGQFGGQPPDGAHYAGQQGELQQYRQAGDSAQYGAQGVDPSQYGQGPSQTYVEQYQQQQYISPPAP